jgi:putative ABC transport system permease protein
LVGALIVSHLMAGLLYGVSPTDLPTFAGVTLLLTIVALAASYVPALRATHLDPITVLQSE